MNRLEQAKMLVERVDTATVPDVPALHGRLLHAQAHAEIAQAEAAEAAALSALLAANLVNGDLASDAMLRVTKWARSVLS